MRTRKPCTCTCSSTWTKTAIAVGLLVAVMASPVWAYDAATTHAGLTERSVLASGLHRVLARRLARPLGLFEPIALKLDHLPPEQARTFDYRFRTLDPAGGYRPNADNVASAMAWVISGAVIAQTPASRGQHLFYDPSRGAGLAQAGGLFQIGYSLRQLLDADSGLRALATGSDFNMTGRPSTEWLAAPENDVGLTAFHQQLEAAVTDEEPGRRATALARALLALGGTLAVLQDAGEPAHVRNDFRRAYLGSGGSSPFDRGSAFERYVADAYGRMGVPAAAAPVARPNVMAFISAGDAQGLADRTQRRFFSDGSLPEDAIVDRDTTTAEVMGDARATLQYGLPRLPRLELRVMGQKQYAYATDDGGSRRRLLAYRRVPGKVRFFLDRVVYADTARLLLPEIGAYGAGLIDHLFRAEIRIEIDAGTAAVSVVSVKGDAPKGEVRLFADDATGRRRAFGKVAAGESPVSVSIPGGTRRIAAVLRGTDGAGEVVAVAEKTF